ncbi:hypothetical protein BFW38_06170 [Terasakiispira papahanaumokuakeensis]|uniref:Uncharacterized protein n=1 Tax=Terasakiispira papahanaumokuakeensis TaxID=197479 RepID=A0A1E2V849_9GAMM|nr:hypothetical protein [Terasakiispira papahanaumokuakeensis]ODC03190.1 hypothetical protein BFW38_06170 [Terasakiispira papahanaumokuakeensis]
MDKEKVKTTLLEMNELISKLDPAIRESAFEVMIPYYFKDAPAKHKPQQTQPAVTQPQENPAPDNTDIGAFISSFEHDKPKDNVMLLVAWLYSNYGAYPIQAKEIKELGDACGLVTPGRADNTMRQAKRSGKALFNQQGKGWKLTVSGELYLKDTYNVVKGNKEIPKD